MHAAVKDLNLLGYFLTQLVADCRQYGDVVHVVVDHMHFLATAAETAEPGAYKNESTSTAATGAVCTKYVCRTPYATTTTGTVFVHAPTVGV